MFGNRSNTFSFFIYKPSWLILKIIEKRSHSNSNFYFFRFCLVFFYLFHLWTLLLIIKTEGLILLYKNNNPFIHNLLNAKTVGLLDLSFIYYIIKYKVYYTYIYLFISVLKTGNIFTTISTLTLNRFLARKSYKLNFFLFIHKIIHRISCWFTEVYIKLIKRNGIATIYVNQLKCRL